MNIKKELLNTARNSIRLKIGGETENKPGATRFGGNPDVPEDFEWPYFEGEGFDGVKNRPLGFIAQFDLEEIAKYDKDGLLPKTGLLSFFYELDTMMWGFDPEHKGCARVFYFEDKNALQTAEYPDDLADDFRLPPLEIELSSEISYQSYEDFLLQRNKLIENWDEFDDARKSLAADDNEQISKLLGWADPIQENMTMECELVSRGYYLGEGWGDVTPLDRQEAEQWSSKDWLPLFQLDSISNGEFDLMFGDCGRIYYYIRRDDLANRNFDDAWLILQCF